MKIYVEDENIQEGSDVLQVYTYLMSQMKCCSDHSCFLNIEPHLGWSAFTSLKYFGVTKHVYISNLYLNKLSLFLKDITGDRLMLEYSFTV